MRVCEERWSEGVIMTGHALFWARCRAHWLELCDIEFDFEILNTQKSEKIHS